MRKNEQHLKKELHPRPSMPFFESSLVFLRAKLQWTSLHIKHSSLPKTRNIVEKEKKKQKTRALGISYLFAFAFDKSGLFSSGWICLMYVCVFLFKMETEPRREEAGMRQGKTERFDAG